MARPGREFLVGARHTFEDLAVAIDTAFGRWDRSHLCMFTMATGERFGRPDPDDDQPVTDLRRAVVAENVKPDSVFRYLFDFGDRWTHRCEVSAEKVNPMDSYGREPAVPTVTFGWGELPDQYGRRWRDDDGSSPVPPADRQRDPMIWPGWPDVPSLAPALTGEDLRTLRGAIAGGDAAAIVDVLAGKDATELLQHAGDGVLVALVAGHPAAAAIGEDVAAGLESRDWAGDADLAEFLHVRLRGVESKLRPLPVDLASVHELLEGDPNMFSGGWLNLRTGETWPEIVDDDEEDDEDREGNPDWRFVDIRGSRDAYRDMARLPRRWRILRWRLDCPKPSTVGAPFTVFVECSTAHPRKKVFAG